MKRIAALWQSVSTVLAREGVPGTRAFGVYVPYAYPETLQALGEGDTLGWLEARMASERERYLERLVQARAHAPLFASWRHADPADVSRPRFDQRWFSGVDGAMAYAMVRQVRPRRIIEVGSGHSTRFLARAICDGGLSTHLHSIDPQPRRDIDALCDAVTRASVTVVDLEVFSQLGHDDVLFVDGSHALLPGSDVDHLFTRVFPALEAGVLIHVHDVFLPAGYPRAWQRRAYTEQSVLAAMLGAGERYAIVCPNAWLRRNEQAAVGALEADLAPGALESSFWMRVRAGSD